MREDHKIFDLVKGRPYNSELRNELAQLGLRRISNNLWISKVTATKYELILQGEDEQKIVSGIDAIDNGCRVHLSDKAAKASVQEIIPQAPEVTLHYKTVQALQRHLENSYFFYQLIEDWNYEIYRGSAFGQQLAAIAKHPEIAWCDFIFLPDPTATGEYIFGTIHKGKAASIHAWLDAFDDNYIVPAEPTPDGAYDSLICGQEFHEWEQNTFETAAAAGQHAIKMLNSSNTTYANAIKQLLGKENGKISRNDFFRNTENQMCRLEIERTNHGVLFHEVPVTPTVVECIDSLLAPYIKAHILQQQRQNEPHSW